MKKIISYILLTAMLVLPLGGCGAEGKESANVSNTGELQGAEGEWDVSGDLALGGKDNSLDAYSSVLNAPLRVEMPPKVIGGIDENFLGVSRAYRFRKNLFERPSACWDELSFVTAGGEMGSKSFDLEHQLWGIGPVAGTDHYVIFDCERLESGEFRYFLTERDESHGTVKEFPLSFLDGWGENVALSSIHKIAADSFGTAHVVQYVGERWKYLLVSTEGKILAEYDGNVEKLVPLCDGRVAFLTMKWDDEGKSRMALQYMDAETGELMLLAATEMAAHYITLFDEKTLLYADYQGIYRSGLSGEKPELLYRWSSHGILQPRVSALQADGKGGIALIYEESGNRNYLCLEPTTEEVEVREITMAVSSGRMSAYLPIVVAFNKQYPSWHIELKSDYDETVLLTELTAGKGPVLVDTCLTGFEEQEKLWEPLDSVVEQMGIAEELQLSALEMGKIDGTLYGIVTDFSLHTLVSGDSELKDWDYDAFLQCAEDGQKLEALFDQYDGEFGAYFILSFLSHGTGDSYFLNEEAGKISFDSSKFSRALELAEKYCIREEGVSPDNSSLLEGKVLCNKLDICKPEDLALYRICYGEDANYIGYPTKDGSVHFMESYSPVAVRRTATEEEKAAACAFIALCLSHDAQIRAAKDLNFGLSVRKDVLEEQISALDEWTEVYTRGFGQFMLGDDLNIELDRETLLRMIEEAEPRRYFQAELNNIFYEELEQYFSGTITEDMLIDHLENRVGLYLGERN